MIVSIRGKIAHKSPTSLVIEAQGSGLSYEVRISLHTFEKVKALESCKLYTHYYIKGDQHVLYGFASLSEKQWFMHLIDVNGIGPSTALTVLSSLNPLELQGILLAKDFMALKAIKGIGDKAARRIVLELGGKLVPPEGLDGGTDAAEAQPSVSIKMEALAALTKLGISKSIAEKAIEKAYPTLAQPTVEALVKAALKM